MTLTYLKATSAIVLVTSGLLLAGTTVLSRPAPPEAPPAVEPEPGTQVASGTETKNSVIVRVPSARDGLLVAIGTEIEPGKEVPADRRITATAGYLLARVGDGETVQREQVILQDENRVRWRLWRDSDPAESSRLQVYKAKKVYRPLEVGDRVKDGQVIALLDSTLALADLNVKLANLRANEADVLATRETKEEAERRVKAMEESMRRLPGPTSKDDYEGAKLTVTRYQEEEVAKKAKLTRSRLEVLLAATILSMYEINSPVEGVIRSIEHVPGEAVKALDTVLTVEVSRKPRRAPDGAKSGKK
jgi:biotin carboxyl carrier protein